MNRRIAYLALRVSRLHIMKPTLKLNYGVRLPPNMSSFFALLRESVHEKR